MRAPTGWRLAVVLALLAVGCARRATVSGTVTYEGKPVPGGVVFVFDAEGTGPYGHGTIGAGGRYTVTNLVPGKKKIRLAGRRPYYPPSEATERLPPPVPEFPDDAQGNDQIVELRPGAQTLDIALTRPAGKQ